MIAIGIVSACISIFGAFMSLLVADNWLRALRNQRIDECFAAIFSMKGYADRCISLLEKEVHNNKICVSAR